MDINLWRKSYTVDAHALFSNASLVAMKADYLQLIEEQPELLMNSAETLYDMLCQGNQVIEVTQVLMYFSNQAQCDTAMDEYYIIIRGEV